MNNEEWENLDLNATSAIRLSLVEDVLANVQGISTAKELLEKLEEIIKQKASLI